MSELRQAYLTMAEYVRNTHPFMQGRRLRYDETQVFKEANHENSRRHYRSYRNAQERLDHSLNRAKKFKVVKIACDCKFCDEKYYLITWKERDEKKWSVKEGSCIFCVTLQLARIAMHYGRDNDPYLIERLRTQCATPLTK